MLQRVGGQLKPRLDLLHHVILIELGEQRRDLSLAERVVQHIVDGLNA